MVILKDCCNFTPKIGGFMIQFGEHMIFGLKLPTSGRCVTLSKRNFRQKVTQQVGFCNNGTHP